jgi:hypothetical protein
VVEKPEVAREIIRKSNVVNVAGLSLEVRLKPSRAGQISLMPEYTANLKILVLLYWADKPKNIIVFHAPFTVTKFLNAIRVLEKDVKSFLFKFFNFSDLFIL